MCNLRGPALQSEALTYPSFVDPNVSCFTMRQTTRDILREEMEKEEEVDSFKLKKTSKSWAALADWAPSGHVLLFIDDLFALSSFWWFVLSLDLISLSRLVHCHAGSAGSAPGPAGDEEDVDSISEEEAGVSGDAAAKVMKQLGFPEVESSKFNPADFPKVAKCINKRITKLDDINKRLGELPNPSSTQTAFLDLSWLRGSVHCILVRLSLSICLVPCKVQIHQAKK